MSNEHAGIDEHPPRLLDFHQERIRVLHYTWIAFFMTFFVWFNLAPLATTMRDTSDWLTKEHIKILLIANVALTIPARIIVGTLIDRFGARIVFTWLMITMSIPAILFAVSTTFTIAIAFVIRYSLFVVVVIVQGINNLEDLMDVDITIAIAFVIRYSLFIVVVIHRGVATIWRI